MSGEYWTVGQANDPQPEDKLTYFRTIEEAIDGAQSRANCNYNTPIAIWDNRNDIVYLFLCGEQFLRM